MYEYENAVKRSSRARIISESGRLVRVRIRAIEVAAERSE